MLCYTAFHTIYCHISRLLLDSYDFEEIQEIAVHNNVDFRFFPVDDAITLEYDDTVILTFTPDDPSLISRLETAGEYIRDTATVNIIDNDRKP